MLNDAVTSFISLIGLLYSILVGQVFGFLYSQQEVSAKCVLNLMDMSRYYHIANSILSHANK